MNILLTSTQVPGAASGVRVHYERLAALLRAEGHTVTVVTLADARPVPSRIIGSLRHALGLLPGRLGERLGIELSEIAKIYFAIDRHQAYDVVNAQDVGSGWAARLALRDQVPVVVTGHYNDHPGEEVIKQLRLPEKSLAARFELRWFNFLLSRTQFFLSISEYALRMTRTLLPPATRTTIVHNGVDMAAFAPPKGPRPPAAGPNLRALYPGRPIVLNIGQLEARKNQQYMVRMASELRQLHPGCLTVLVGKGEDEPMLRALIAEHGLEHDVVLLGYHSQVAPLLHAADLYVHTATRENCPYVVIEAMAAGCPALALAAGGSPELLAGTPEASLPQSTPPAALAQQVAELLADPAARRSLQQRQYAYARTRFDTAAMARGTLAFYQQARGLAPPEAPRPTSPRPAHAAHPA
ncbi:glycosyltransferase family 4 protein [Hymenobacter sp. RP-2-7]|uniref:Glycosyltransferase family 4 protein n=1 Tax=Hymenobacter polaris TaxID=2682546 RepID=A0A7Y0AHZ1_9BACT|nr:glycosyltransferase family 4 protein [Hymenobacter polaris]NML67718.1 glycosyltransferase family 4 protein [Hymenobacter polaris]